MNSGKLRAVGRMIRQAQNATKYVTGTTTAAPVNGSVTVDLGSQVVPATVPGSFRGNVVSGQQVQLAVQGMLYTVSSVLSPLTTPTVATAPADSDVSPLTMDYLVGLTDAGFSNSGFTAQDFQCGLYAEYVKDRVNGLVDVTNDHQDAFVQMQNTLNDLATTVRGIRSALAAQGHVA